MPVISLSQRYQWHAMRSLLSYYILGGDSDISGIQCGPCSLTIFLAATAISVACNAVLALTIFLAVTAISAACNAVIALTIFLAVTAISTACNAVLAFTIFLAVTAISTA